MIHSCQKLPRKKKQQQEKDHLQKCFMELEITTACVFQLKTLQ